MQPSGSRAVVPASEALETGARRMSDEAVTTAGIGRHGATRLPSVDVDSYNIELKDTDGDGEVFERQQQYQEKNFQTVALPYYAILDGDGKTVSTFPGLTRNTQEFIDFLEKPLGN